MAIQMLAHKKKTLRLSFSKSCINPFLGGQAFKSYDEAGAVRRIQCLKYLVLATMLMESAVDPFDAQARLPVAQSPVSETRHAMQLYFRD